MKAKLIRNQRTEGSELYRDSHRKSEHKTSKREGKREGDETGGSIDLKKPSCHVSRDGGRKAMRINRRVSGRDGYLEYFTHRSNESSPAEEGVKGKHRERKASLFRRAAIVYASFA